MATKDKSADDAGKMGRILNYLAVLGIVAVVALTGYGYLVDMAPSQGERRVPVLLDGG